MAEDGTQAPANDQDDGQNAQPNAAQQQTRTFTQDELDRIVEQRLSRTKAQFKDFDQYKQAAERLAQLEAANQTETEKLRAAAEKANQRAQDLEERATRAEGRANDTLIRAAVVAEASRQQAVDPDAVYALLDRSQLKLGDDDRVAGVEEAVKALLDDRSYLVGGRPNGGFDGGARQSAPAGSSRADLNAQIRRAAGFA